MKFAQETVLLFLWCCCLCSLTRAAAAEQQEEKTRSEEEERKKDNIFARREHVAEVERKDNIFVRRQRLRVRRNEDILIHFEQSGSSASSTSFVQYGIGGGSSSLSEEAGQGTDNAEEEDSIAAETEIAIYRLLQLELSMNSIPQSSDEQCDFDKFKGTITYSDDSSSYMLMLGEQWTQDYLPNGAKVLVGFFADNIGPTKNDSTGLMEYVQEYKGGTLGQECSTPEKLREGTFKLIIDPTINGISISGGEGPSCDNLLEVTSNSCEFFYDWISSTTN